MVVNIISIYGIIGQNSGYKSDVTLAITRGAEKRNPELVEGK